MKTLGILVCAVIWYLSVYYFLQKWSTIQVHPLNEQQPQNGGGDQQQPPQHGDGHREAQPENDPHQQEAHHLGGNGQGGQEDPPHHEHVHDSNMLPGSDGNHDAPRTDKVELSQDRTLPPLDNSGDENGRALGTFGYDAAEYAMSGKLNATCAPHNLGDIIQKLLADHTLTSGQQSLVSRAIPEDEKLGGGGDCPTKAVSIFKFCINFHLLHPLSLQFCLPF